MSDTRSIGPPIGQPIGAPIAPTAGNVVDLKAWRKAAESVPPHQVVMSCSNCREIHWYLHGDGLARCGGCGQAWAVWAKLMAPQP